MPVGHRRHVYERHHRHQFIRLHHQIDPQTAALVEPQDDYGDDDHKLDAWAAEQAGRGRFPHAVIDKVEKELRAAKVRAMAILEDRRTDLDHLTRRLLAEREIDFERDVNKGIEPDSGVDRDQGPSVLPDTARAIW